MALNLEQLYDGHAQALFTFLLNLTRNEAETKDLLQEVFIKLAKQPNLLNGVRDERAFLIRLAHNSAIDQMRRRGTRDKNHETFATEEDFIFEAIDHVDEQSFREELSKALGELPADQRAVVHLKLW